ncbi:hypothetical protein CLHUN_01750 [Ruminiclostridium hungatei]|uniref:Uncharacterized protein n=2 Tax=Ruminiclostridium hungatei TaxID=48256 RepID=A0A1V4SR33_RUMHU|nr:hypothetical protein CLHUN_01750 [Ruminiclostridium hungatei]
MYRCATDQVTGEKFGWGRVLDYIGVKWEDEYIEYEQTSLFDYYPDEPDFDPDIDEE